MGTLHAQLGGIMCFLNHMPHGPASWCYAVCDRPVNYDDHANNGNVFVRRRCRTQDP